MSYADFHATVQHPFSPACDKKVFAQDQLFIFPTMICVTCRTTCKTELSEELEQIRLIYEYGTYVSRMWHQALSLPTLSVPMAYIKNRLELL